MSICYSEHRDPTRSGRPPAHLDSVKQYLTHYANYLRLNHLSMHGNRDEQSRARLELSICERKMAYWERREGFNLDAALRGIQALKRARRAGAVQ